MTSGTLYSIVRMSSLFLHSRNRSVKSYYNKTTKRKCVTLFYLKLLLLCFFLFQFLNKIDIRKSKIKNFKEVNTHHEFVCLHSIKSMELVEETELLRRLCDYALPKIHLDRYGSFHKILLILSWKMNLNPGPVLGIQKLLLLFFSFLIYLQAQKFFLLVCFCSISLISSSIGSFTLISSKSLFASSDHLF